MVRHDPGPLDVIGETGDQCTGALIHAQRVRQFTERELRARQVLQRPHQHRRVRATPALDDLDGASRSVAGFRGFASQHQQPGQVGQRGRLVPLQRRALFALGDLQRLAQCSFGLLELAQPLEALAQPHVRRHALRGGARHLLFDFDGAFRVATHGREFFLAPCDVDVGVLYGRRRLAGHFAVLGQDGFGAGQESLGRIELPQQRQALREAHQNLLQLDLARAGVVLADAQRLAPRGHGIGVAALPRGDPGVRDVDLRDLGGIGT